MNLLYLSISYHIVEMFSELKQAPICGFNNRLLKTVYPINTNLNLYAG